MIMVNPKGADGVPLNEGDSVELLENVKIESQILPKGTVLHGLRYWYDESYVEIGSVQVGAKLKESVIPTQCLKKIKTLVFEGIRRE